MYFVDYYLKADDAKLLIINLMEVIRITVLITIITESV